MVNKYKPHVIVLPEDNADRKLATGFQLEVPNRQMQVLHEVGGWLEVLDRFEKDHISSMERWPGRLMVLLIDFDGRPEKLQQAQKRVPAHLSDRVFVLGALIEPENLKADLGNYESIGRSLARDCRNKTTIVWDHEHLRHNAGELQRLTVKLHPILFHP